MHIKRILDFTLALIGLIILFPLLVLISALVYIKLGSPIFFIQDRPGLNGVIFKMIKFRSMLTTKDKSGNLLPDHLRRSAFGRFLRKSSIDELPTLLNVLIGNMSLVGPRPLLIEYLPLYNKKQAKRHNVRPGITGLAQISGRNLITWEQKFEKDVFYVENLKIMLDVKILLLTIKKIFIREGIDYEDETINNKFTGDK